MSRSYKKFTISRMTLWGRKSMKKGKQYANRKIRHKLRDCTIDVSNGSEYKRHGVDRYDLYEFKFYETKQEAIARWESEQSDLANGVCSWRTIYYESLEEVLQEWDKYYRRK